MTNKPIVVVKPPSLCTEAELNAFVDCAAEGGEVDRANLETGARRAKALLWIAEGSALVGVSALKLPRDSYRRRVFTDTNSGLDWRPFKLELGYLFVVPGKQDKGYGRTLLDETLALAGSDAVFATTRVDNEKMHNALPNRGFTRIEPPYGSTDGTRSLVLYVKPRKG
jgi:hypothetical protein